MSKRFVTSAHRAKAGDAKPHERAIRQLATVPAAPPSVPRDSRMSSASPSLPAPSFDARDCSERPSVNASKLRSAYGLATTNPARAAPAARPRSSGGRRPPTRRQPRAGSLLTEAITLALVVLSGDHPLISAETIAGLLEAHGQADAAATVMTTILDEPGAGAEVHLRRQRELLGERIARLELMVTAIDSRPTRGSARPKIICA